jgi:uncharacterized protein (DUF952 family)
MDPEPHSAVVFHLTTPAAWEQARAEGRVEPPSLRGEGFVHCSTPEQLAGTIERHFGAVDELVLLRLDAAAVGDALRWEASRPGEVYPHVYRALDPDEVVDVVWWRRGETPLPE